MSFFKQLFIDTYIKDGVHLNEIERIYKTLLPRAWLIHLCINATRIVYPILGIARWQTAYENSDDIETLDQEFSNKYESFIKTSIIILVVLGGVLDLLIICNMRLTKLIIFFELIMAIAKGFVPYDYGEVGYQLWVSYIALISLGFQCERRWSTICCIITQTFIVFIVLPKMYNDDIDAKFIGARIIDLLIVTVCIVLFNMMFTYVAIIRGKNNQLFDQNIKLLDKMHEGLIVVTEKDVEIKFANKPARHLLK